MSMLLFPLGRYQLISTSPLEILLVVSPHFMFL
uniref:Uncharacterized protein n=1 Tax=Anguilla anguilla TaxID=7936 RepID=A0A0E9PYM1_ANGAN